MFTDGWRTARGKKPAERRFGRTLPQSLTIFGKGGLNFGRSGNQQCNSRPKPEEKVQDLVVAFGTVEKSLERGNGALPKGTRTKAKVRGKRRRGKRADEELALEVVESNKYKGRPKKSQGC